MQIVELTRAEHGNLRIDPARALAAFSATHMVPLAKQEIRRIAADCPVILAKSAETGQFYPAAVLGLEPQENLFWNGRELELGYVPANIQRAPFYVGGELDQGVLCIDMDSPAIDPEGPVGILEADGSDSDYMAGVQSTLAFLAQQQSLTAAFVQEIADKGLLSPIELDISLDDGGRIRLQGIYGIDEPALERAFQVLDNTQDKLLCAAMALSLDRFNDLVARKNSRLTEQAAWTTGGFKNDTH
jgi:hypothetical protein